MGILNVTPDSFSGDGTHLDVAGAVERAATLVREGADIIDRSSGFMKPLSGMPAPASVPVEVPVPVSLRDPAPGHKSRG